MSVGLDTSVVVRLLSGEPPDLARAALEYLRQRQREDDPVLISDWVVAEAYYAFQHHYQVGKRETLQALRALLETPGIEATGEAAQVLATRKLESANPGFIDRLIYRDYLRSGATRMATFEKAARRLPRVDVLTGGAQ